MASHVFTRTSRLRPRRGHIALYGLGAPTVGDATDNTLPPDASYASIVSPTGVPSQSGPDIDTANDILPTVQQPTGMDVTPSQINPMAIAPATPNTNTVPTVPSASSATSMTVKHDLWYWAKTLAPWAVGGSLLLGLGSLFFFRRGRKKSRR